MPVDQLTVSEGVVTVAADPSRTATYGELIGGRRFNITLTGATINATTGVAAVKAVQDLKIVGQSLQRYDIPPKVDGSLRWAADVKLPGMVHARNVKPPVAGATLVSKHGCIACHDVKGTVRLVGPPLTNVRERLSAAEIRQSILDPDAVVAEGFPPGLMLKTFADTVPPEELDQIVGYLSGEVSLAERLSHPGVHLVALILLFNGGVWIIRRLALSRAASGGSNA